MPPTLRRRSRPLRPGGQHRHRQRRPAPSQERRRPHRLRIQPWWGEGESKETSLSTRTCTEDILVALLPLHTRTRAFDNGDLERLVVATAGDDRGSPRAAVRHLRISAKRDLRGPTAYFALPAPAEVRE